MAVEYQKNSQFLPLIVPMNNQIALILKSAVIIETFRQNLAEVDDELTSLSTIRKIINSFILRLQQSIHRDIKLNLLDDTNLLEAVDALTVERTTLKEEKAIADLETSKLVLMHPILYAVHMIPMDAFEEWECLEEYV